MSAMLAKLHALSSGIPIDVMSRSHPDQNSRTGSSMSRWNILIIALESPKARTVVSSPLRSLRKVS